MLNYNVTYTEAPAPTLIQRLPAGEYDVWLRKGVGSETKTDEQGGEFIEYYAEQEAYARLDSAPDLEDFDAAFDAVAGWQPPKPEEPADEVAELRKRLTEQENELLNTQLALCDVYELLNGGLE